MVYDPKNLESIVVALESALSLLNEKKPVSAGGQARCYAIAITDLEKLIAYVKVYIGGAHG